MRVGTLREWAWLVHNAFQDRGKETPRFVRRYLEKVEARRALENPDVREALRRVVKEDEKRTS